MVVEEAGEGGKAAERKSAACLKLGGEGNAKGEGMGAAVVGHGEDRVGELDGGVDWG